jgi:hypothetical protein
MLNDKAMTRSFENFTRISFLFICFSFLRYQIITAGKSEKVFFFSFFFFYLYHRPALHYAFMSFCNPISSVTLFLIDTPLAFSLVYIYSYVDKCYVHRFIMMHYYEFFFFFTSKETKHHSVIT